MVCNPCGYINRAGKPENAAFDQNFIVELVKPVDIVELQKIL
ncbi:hypothetical protein [Janthinobacterium agaricidamnosum]|uniref:Uncharacterized protein n=1 Tax=Janthinobacterium agaricidamnosum NBRC 102515 = DSM 9628 TaxID=1349767 RepID=W0VDQ5_9BURK|nr:hypothetical protein [Janthinobacterium agaricidamnosum]CDG85427.1 hypothetical protein GJA_4823 [Janthinobacterium agaricidamnosum NBRC 102515 = DSM 9628]